MTSTPLSSQNLAFVFPGQGSQSVGMLDGWQHHPAVQHTLQEASDALDEDIGSLIASGPKEALGLTTNTQPVMLVAGVAAYRVWLAEGGTPPNIVAGHSLGEYAALVAAESLSLTDAVPLVRLRAAAMQEAVPVGTGAMAAILGMAAEQVDGLCRQVTEEMNQPGELVEAVNFNDPLQTVVAGSKAAVDKACEVIKAAGAKRALLLPVSAPFHCSLMRPAAEILKARLQEVPVSAPKIMLVNNIDVQTETDPTRIKDALYRQAFGPVRWVQTVQWMRSQGVTQIVESGPGKVLTGMVKRISPDVMGLSLYDMASLVEVKAALAAPQHI